MSDIDWGSLIAIVTALAALVTAFVKLPGDRARSKAELIEKFQAMLNTATDELKEARVDLSKATRDIMELTKRVVELESQVAVLERKLRISERINRALRQALDDNGIDIDTIPLEHG